MLNKSNRATSKVRDTEERRLLKRIADQIRKDLYRNGKTVEWLAFESETSRATVRRVFDADRNVGILTLDRVAKALGYRGIADFFEKRNNQHIR